MTISPLRTLSRGNIPLPFRGRWFMFTYYAEPPSCALISLGSIVWVSIPIASRRFRGMLEDILMSLTNFFLMNSCVVIFVLF